MPSVQWTDKTEKDTEECNLAEGSFVSGRGWPTRMRDREKERDPQLFGHIIISGFTQPVW